MFKFLNFSQKDIERQLTLFLMGVMVLFLFPFSIYRLITGDMIQFAVDLVMAMIAAFIFVQTWRSKRSKKLNYLSVISSLLLISVLIHLKGIDLVFWMFPGMIGTYFLLASTPAAISNVIFILANTLLFFEKLTVHQVTSIYPSLIMVCIFGYILSKRAEYQNKRLSKLVSEDTLTGVKNRRSFDEKIEEILANQKRGSFMVSMLLLDIDYFKKINDSYGHKQGDKVLVDFAQAVEALIRNTDYMYRFGGEEFVVIANNSSLENAGILAESIRKFIEANEFLSEYKVTVSIGVAEVETSDDADSFFHRADAALYEAKSSGRNRVVLAKRDQDNKVFCEGITDSKEIKGISAKTHRLIRSRDDEYSKRFVERHSDASNDANKIDKT